MEHLISNGTDMPAYAAWLLYTPAFFIPTFFTFLIDGNWSALIISSVMLFMPILINTVVLQRFSAALFKRNFWVLMLPMTIGCMVAMYFQGYPMELIGWSAAAGFVATLTMLVTAYPIIRSRITLRQLRWEGYRQKMSKKAYTQACREKLGAIIFHPLAFLFFLAYTSGYNLSNAPVTQSETQSESFDDEGLDDESLFSNTGLFDEDDDSGSLCKHGTTYFAMGLGVFETYWD